MVSREEPRITQVSQGINLLDKNQPVYNLLDHNFTVGVSASKWYIEELDNGEVEFIQEFIDIREVADSVAF